MPAPHTLRSPFCSTNLPLPTPPWEAASRCLGLAGQVPPTERSVTEDLTRFLVKTSPLYTAMCPQLVITTSQRQPNPFSSQHSPPLLRSGSCNGVPSFFRRAALRSQGFLSLFRVRAPRYLPDTRGRVKASGARSCCRSRWRGRAARRPRGYRCLPLGAISGSWLEISTRLHCSSTAAEVHWLSLLQHLFHPQKSDLALEKIKDKTKFWGESCSLWKSQGLFPLCVVLYTFLLPTQCIEQSERLFPCRKLKAIYRCQPGRLWVSFSLLILLLVSFQVVEKLQPSRYVPGRMVNLHLILCLPWQSIQAQSRPAQHHPAASSLETQEIQEEEVPTGATPSNPCTLLRSPSNQASLKPLPGWRWQRPAVTAPTLLCSRDAVGIFAARADTSSCSASPCTEPRGLSSRADPHLAFVLGLVSPGAGPGLRPLCISWGSFWSVPPAHPSPPAALQHLPGLGTPTSSPSAPPDPMPFSLLAFPPAVQGHHRAAVVLHPPRPGSMAAPSSQELRPAAVPPPK